MLGEEEGYTGLCLGVEDCCNGDFIAAEFFCDLFEAGKSH